MNYYKGRNNLACTIFVPFKCGNNCPFCNTKQMYDGFEFSRDKVDAIIDMIEKVNESVYVKEFVITGGEPFFNLPVLKELVSHMKKPVYINTSMPLVNNIDDVIKYINSEDKIESISVSRHMGYTHDVHVCDRETLDYIEKYVRINTVVTENDLDKIEAFFEYWAAPYRMVNLRADYRTITTDNLKNRDKISQFMLENFQWEYTNGCLVCNSEIYTDGWNRAISYHRGMESSCVTVGERCYVNDVLVDMNGNVYKDWDMKKDEYFEAWLFEKPKL